MCLIGCLSLFLPRVGILLLLAFSPAWLLGPYEPWWLVIPGFLLLPYTTLAYAFGVQTVGPVGDMSALGWIIVIVALVVDLGHWGEGARRAPKKTERREVS